MDINNLVERIKSSRIIIAVGVLVIVAGGPAYFYLVYQPQMQSNAVTAMPPSVRKPLPAPAKTAAKPVSSQPTVPVSSMPDTVSPGVSSGQQPAIALASSAVAPIPEKIAEPAKPKLVVQKFEPKNRKAVTRPKQVAKPELPAKPEQVAKIDNEFDTPDTSQQVPPKPQDVLLVPANSPGEPVPTPAPTEPFPVEPAPIPAPVESVPVAPVESAPERGVISPKYNDIMTAVLRSDREAAKELLDLGWWVDKPSENGITPLMAAVMNRDTQMVQLLLDYGAQPSAQALKLAHKNKDAATVSLLEQKGAR